MRLQNNHKVLLNPIGERVYPEYENKVSQHIELQGFGSGKGRKLDDDEKFASFRK